MKCLTAVKLLFLFLLTWAFVSCSSAPAPDAGFVEAPKRQQHIAYFPFDDVWLKDNHNWSSYSNVIVAPVNTSHLLKMDWWEKASFADRDAASVQKLADYMRDSVLKAYQQYPQNRMKVTDHTGPNTIKLELAIVDLVPTKTWLNAIGYLLVGQLSRGRIGMEGRIRDVTTNEVIATFKDDRHGQVDVVSTRDFSFWAHVKHVVEVWAEELVELSNDTENKPVKPMSPFTLKPW